MGRGDNRKTLKHRRRKAQKKKMLRIQRRIAGIARPVLGVKAPAAKAAPKKAPGTVKTVTRKVTEE